MFVLLVCSQSFNRGKCAIAIWFRTGNFKLNRRGFLPASYGFLLLLDLLSCILGFRNTFFALGFKTTVLVAGKHLLVLQELFFSLKTTTTLVALEGVDVCRHFLVLMHCYAMFSKSKAIREQSTAVLARKSSFCACKSSVLS